MTTHTHIRRVAAGALTLSLLVPVFVSAQTGGATVTTQAQGSNAGASASMSATIMTRAKEKASKEIDRRIKALNDLATRITSVSKISEEFKKNLNTNVQNQVNLLTTLKTKIEADTDGPTLRADIQSVAETYRIFALVMPQARIAAAADREATIINMMLGLGAKLQARLQEAQQAGADITALSTTLTDMGTKLSTAQAHAQAAIAGSAVLIPDGGDKDKMKANTDALKAARAEIEAAHRDLVAARKDADIIAKGLKTLKINTASTTSQTP